MKTRKKTKLCLQCNGVNPMSATHCAYCGALLTGEELVQPNPPPREQEWGAQAPYRPLSPELVDRAGDEARAVEKPLYSVFDQPPQPQIDPLGGPPHEGAAPRVHSSQLWLSYFEQGPLLELISSCALFFGVLLATLAILTLLCAQDGLLVLSWHTQVAPWLLGLGALLLLLSWSALGRSALEK